MDLNTDLPWSLFFSYSPQRVENNVWEVHFKGWYWIKRRASSLANTPWINSLSVTRSATRREKKLSSGCKSKDKVIIVAFRDQRTAVPPGLLHGRPGETKLLPHSYNMITFSPFSLFLNNFHSFSVLLSTVFSSEGSLQISSLGIILKIAWWQIKRRGEERKTWHFLKYEKVYGGKQREVLAVADC